MQNLHDPPDDLSPIAILAFGILAEQTSFPGPVLIAHLRRNGQNPATVDARGLACAIEDIAIGVGRFTSPQKADVVRCALHRLVEEHTASRL